MIHSIVCVVDPCMAEMEKCEVNKKREKNNLIYRFVFFKEGDGKEVLMTADCCKKLF